MQIEKKHELFSNKNKKNIGKLRTKTRAKVFIDEFICCRKKAYSFLCVSDDKNKLKGISRSQSEKKKFKENYIYAYGKKHQREGDNHVIRSIIHII